MKCPKCQGDLRVEETITVGSHSTSGRRCASCRTKFTTVTAVLCPSSHGRGAHAIASRIRRGASVVVSVSKR